MMRSARRLLFFFLTATVPLMAQAAPIRQVYLVQNSGWMEPYFLDPQSQFISLARSLIEATQLEDVDVTVASFNQDGQLPGQRSPNVLYAGPFAPDVIEKKLTSLTVPRRPNGRYADADFLSALQATITDLLHQQDGIIWMLSNNKNSPNNSQDVAANTRGFYDLLRNSSYVTRIVAFPLRMPVSGPNFSEKGFIVYGIAYGQLGARALDVLTAPGTPLRDLFADPPIFLKPLEPQVLELNMQHQDVADGATIEIQNGIVVVDGLKAEETSTISFTGTLQNVAYPKKIVSAHVTAAWEGKGSGTNAVQANPPVISNLAMGATSPPLRFTLTIPGKPRPSGLSGLMTTDVTVDGQMDITLSDLQFELDDNFITKASAVFGGSMMGEGQRSFVEKQLPAIFFDFRNVRERVTSIPIRVILHYSPLPLYAALAVALLAFALLAGLLSQMFRARSYKVKLGADVVPVRLRPRQQVELRSSEGARYRVRGQLFGPPSTSPL
ncbi:hypothetical protein [Aquabacter sediminis]|uniref:hypothetical protein n=1 Tax=Aquabacter sediminis TaxID=3029197 RepID=UPI00237D4E20|nr:hypothetical protein [Aquabacter sp. P-9]MDE1567857.1 hypothetical protein [Aquabacter sp. P-9]